MPKASWLRTTPADTGGEANAASPSRGPFNKWNLVVFGVILAAALVFFAFAGAGASPSSSTTTYTTTTSTSFDVLAPYVIASAMQQNSMGYSVSSSNQLHPSDAGAENAGYAIVSKGGSGGNVTVIVFDSPTSAQAYYHSFVSNVQSLSGYSDATSALTGYEQYGACYGFGEDADGIAVANGICTEGNVFLQVHLASDASLPDLEGDMAGLVGSMYHVVA